MGKRQNKGRGGRRQGKRRISREREREKERDNFQAQSTTFERKNRRR